MGKQMVDAKAEITELIYVIKAMQKLYNECYTHRGHSRHNMGINRAVYAGNLKQLLAVMQRDVDKEFEGLKKILAGQKWE